ncbi:hypothetical protein NE237_013832 [Protea cynaroides]|uniref:Dynamin-type G domain-containing protein n=1 Tax=Protea cynaroides TaxID=273540 RepID=A0A9Q0JY87_9MAGN|nr:hypothetical protein NE237_013832 [Protea cynaroides]
MVKLCLGSTTFEDAELTSSSPPSQYPHLHLCFPHYEASQHSSLNPELHLDFQNQEVPKDEAHVAQAIEEATNVIAGDSEGISNTPITLVVKKRGVPDLTMVDLPGIIGGPVRGQPEDIYEQISNIIMEYITPQESIILNVLSATVDFTTCESITMNHRVDRTGERTLAVVTKVDQAPDGLLEQLTADDVNIGLGYVRVRNQIGEELYEEARREERRLFESHSLLSKINKSIVGILVLAQKLHLSNVTDAMTAFMQIIGSAKESLKKILIRGEFDEYPDEKNMHCTFWIYIQDVFIRVLTVHCKSYPQLQSCTRQAIVEMEKLTVCTCNLEYLSKWSKLMAQRLVGNLALHLMFSVQNLVNREMEKEIVNELMGPKESPSVATKRERLNHSIKILGECKDVLRSIRDLIKDPTALLLWASNTDYPFHVTSLPVWSIIV